MKTKNINLNVNYSIINEDGCEFPREIVMNLSGKKAVHHKLKELIDSEVKFVVTNIEIV